MSSVLKTVWQAKNLYSRGTLSALKNQFLHLKPTSHIFITTMGFKIQVIFINGKVAFAAFVQEH